MKTNQFPYLFMYPAFTNYSFFYPFHYPSVFQQKLLESSMPAISLNDLVCKQIPTKINQLTQEKNKKVIIDKQLLKRKQKKYQFNKKIEKDVQFKQRQQTNNRNLCSNTLKVYFKQLRDSNSQTFKNVKKILETKGYKMTVQDFMREIDQQFPPHTTYISFEKVKKVCNHQIKPDILELGKVLRISISRFYAYEIYTVHIKSIRTSRKIRNQQIKQGKIFIRELTL